SRKLQRESFGLLNNFIHAMNSSFKSTTTSKVKVLASLNNLTPCQEIHPSNSRTTSKVKNSPTYDTTTSIVKVLPSQQSSSIPRIHHRPKGGGNIVIRHVCLFSIIPCRGL
ncbi:hypothetical protein L9F63_017479, partial [Diploptera punctata]